MTIVIFKCPMCDMELKLRMDNPSLWVPPLCKRGHEAINMQFWPKEEKADEPFDKSPSEQ